MSYPFLPAPFETQDKKDDDAIVIDQLVQETNAPADIHGAIEPVLPDTKVKPASVTRIISQTYQVYIGNPPVRLLTEDVKRVACRLKVYSLNDTPANITRQDYIIINDEAGKISSGATGINIVCHHNQEVDLDGHTGAVWFIHGPLLTAFIEVSIWAVTEMPAGEVIPL